jgi:hypothetical protein
MSGDYIDHWRRTIILAVQTCQYFLMGRKYHSDQPGLTGPRVNFVTHELRFCRGFLFERKVDEQRGCLDMHTISTQYGSKLGGSIVTDDSDASPRVGIDSLKRESILNCSRSLV